MRGVVKAFNEVIAFNGICYMFYDYGTDLGGWKTQLLYLEPSLGLGMRTRRQISLWSHASLCTHAACAHQFCQL